MQRVRRGGTTMNRRDAVALPPSEPRVRDAPSLQRLVEQLREQAEGLLALADELHTLVKEQGGADALPRLHARPLFPLMFQRQGEYWALSFRGRTAYFRHRVGFTYLQRLVSTPGKRWHCLELMDFRFAEQRKVPTAYAQRTQEVRSAFRRVREQWQALSEQIEEAEQNQDLGRRAALAAQREELRNYMRALMRGPRTDAERARVAVQKAINRALRAVNAEHPSLAAYLRGYVRLGLTCVFSPPTDGPA